VLNATMEPSSPPAKEGLIITAKAALPIMSISRRDAQGEGEGFNEVPRLFPRKEYFNTNLREVNKLTKGNGEDE